MYQAIRQLLYVTAVGTGLAVCAVGADPDPYELAGLPQLIGWSEEADVTGSGDANSADIESEEPSRDELLEALDEYKTRLESLEKSWTSYQDGVKAKSDAAKKAPTFEIGGRIHADYWSFPQASQGIGYFENPVAALPEYGEDPEDFLGFRRIRLETEGDILETMLWRIQVDFNNPGLPEIKDVYAGFKELPFNQVLLIGNQKRPLGLDHLNSSRYNVFLERPFVVEAFNEDARRLGIAAYGYSDDEVYNWRYGVYNLENINVTGRYIGDNLQPSLNARLASSPWYDESSGGRGYLHWAVAGMLAWPDGTASPTATAPPESRFRTRPEARSQTRWLNTDRIAGAQTYEILGLESIFNVGSLQICGEYQANWLQRDATTPGTGPDVFFHGAYLYASYFLTGEFIPYSRTTGTLSRVKPYENFFLVDRCNGGTGHGWGAWEVAARYSWLDVTDADVTGGVGQSWTLALNWYWTAYSKLQTNFIWGNIDDRGPINGYSSGNYFIAGTRVAVDF